jgi:hypothetical protein
MQCPLIPKAVRIGIHSPKELTRAVFCLDFVRVGGTFSGTFVCALASCLCLLLPRPSDTRLPHIGPWTPHTRDHNTEKASNRSYKPNGGASSQGSARLPAALARPLSTMRLVYTAVRCALAVPRRVRKRQKLSKRIDESVMQSLRCAL